MSADPRRASICVFCGSSTNANHQRLREASEIGEAIANLGVRLVYGGGGVGLMGVCSAAARKAGGEVLGVIPAFLTHVEAAPAGSDIVVVETMHQRKRLMFEHSDAFVILPGAIGTLEEAIELLSWRRLGLHDKPILFFNPEGFWDPLFDLFQRFVAEDLLPAEFDGCWRAATRLDDLIAALGDIVRHVSPGVVPNTPI